MQRRPETLEVCDKGGREGGRSRETSLEQVLDELFSVSSFCPGNSPSFVARSRSIGVGWYPQRLKGGVNAAPSHQDSLPEVRLSISGMLPLTTRQQEIIAKVLETAKKAALSAGECVCRGS
eukprot:755922-Hanusia_phi.AAC.3